LSNGPVVLLDVEVEQKNPVGRWILAHDRGEHLRSWQGLKDLIHAAGLVTEEEHRLRVGPLSTVFFVLR